MPMAWIARCLAQRVLHEVSRAQVQHVQSRDPVQDLFKLMQPGYWSGAGFFVRTYAAEDDRVLYSRLFQRRLQLLRAQASLLAAIILAGACWAGS